MKSYGQLCSLALALDAVGDRWSLLVIRELLVRPGGARYTDLRDGLPGIATNLLADRLRDLERNGIVRREEPRPPVATPLFRLTERGAGLRPVVDALVDWGGAEVPAAPADAAFRTRWMIIPAESMLTDTRPSEPAVQLVVRTGDEPLTVRVGGGEVHARTGEPGVDPDLVITGPPKPVLGVLSGKLPVSVASSVGVELRGDRSVLGRIGLVPDADPGS